MGNHEDDDSIDLLHPSVRPGERGIHRFEGMEVQLQLVY